MKTARIALRNLTREKKRSVLLIIAIAFGFFIVCTIDGFATGAIKNFTSKFTELYGGNLLVQGNQKDSNGKIITVSKNDDIIQNALSKINIQYSKPIKRSMFAATIIFNGNTYISNVFGCDFSEEQNLLTKLKLDKNEISLLSKNVNGLIINIDAAEQLGLQLGDQVIIKLKTVTGQNTFGEFVICALTKNSSMIGSVSAYANMDYVNSLLEIGKNDFTLFCVSVDSKQQDLYATLLESEIAKTNSTTNRNEAIKKNPTNISGAIANQLKTTTWDGTKYSVMSLNDAIPFIKQLGTIVGTSTTSMLVIIFLVIMIGISNTYRITLMERYSEIGTMRALGMKQKDIKKMFLQECVFLCLVGAVIGIIISLFISGMISLIPIKIPEIDLFLNNNHLSFNMNFISLLIKIIITSVLTILSVIQSAKQAALLNPADALRTVK